MAGSSEARTPSRGHLTMHDEELLAAKNRGKQVHVCLVFPTSFSDEEGCFDAPVEKVDRYAIRFGIKSGTSVWVMKQAIVSTQVLA